MPDIDHIYLVCNRRELFRVKPCVASIRHFHPDVRITLVKDQGNGPFSTTELEQYWGVSTWVPPRPKTYIFSQIEVLLRPERERFFLMDADILFVGPVLSLFDDCHADFIISWEPGDDCERKDYYSYSRLKESIDPTFTFPGYCFGAGNLVATSGVFSREDYAPYIDYEQSPPMLRFPDIFYCAGQGVTNYLVQSKVAKGETTIAMRDFMIWAYGEDVNNVRSKDVLAKTFRPSLVHWCSQRKESAFCGDPRPDLWEMFDRLYYSRIPCGGMKRLCRSIARSVPYRMRRGRHAIKMTARAALDALGLLPTAVKLKRGAASMFARRG